MSTSLTYREELEAVVGKYLSHLRVARVGEQVELVRSLQETIKHSHFRIERLQVLTTAVTIQSSRHPAANHLP